MNQPHRSSGGRLGSCCLAALSLAVSILLWGCGGGGGGSSDGASPGDGFAGGEVSPALLQWQDQMRVFGERHCDPNEIRSHQTWEGGVWYYDGDRIYYQIADYTGESHWNDCAQYVIDVYRAYVLDNNGAIPGWRVFPHGVLEHFRRTGDGRSRDAVLLLATNSAFAASAGGVHPDLSRETAYIINAYLAAREVGAEQLDPLLQQAVNNALGHLDAWTVSESADPRPFMMGLTFEALIRYFQVSGDDRIPSAISRASDWLWNQGLMKTANTFPLVLCDGSGRGTDCTAPAPDLNLLIAPAYGWLYQQTGNDEFAARGDRLYEAGVFGADLSNGKRFSQNYRWSFSYLEWRAGITRSVTP